MSTPRKIGNYLDCFPLVNILPQWKNKDFKSFGNSSITLPNNCVSTIIADIFPPWHCVNTHLNVPDQQTAKTLASIEVITLADQFLKSTWLLLSLLIPMEAVRVYLNVHTWLLHFGFIVVK